MTTKDRIYRSPAAIAGGVLLLAIAVWLGIDALVQGSGRVPWLALAAMILVIPLVVAFTLRPAVFAGQDRLRVRNPFRVIVLPWSQVAAFRSSYSNEVVAASGTKYQLWAIPVSLRARKKAARRTARAESGGRGGGRTRGMGGLGFPGAGSTAAAADAADGPLRAETDKVMDELRELWEAREKAESAQGEVSVRWAYEVLAPALAGAVLLAILLATG
ncbi:PH domain-containing protein [Streptomyces justiciae]|uniref:PH domain-containing protein n=1 Tax=Streptomyces justiciae TaxID=2780140 RepID=A0ABU3LQ11_9ACTN|nr:PH domain-containing protein [Streptomyces justiciae]MCW8377797.1 PH domain-containing protein [Streptomyces justiciae]MDT7840859.1 PH domain-containing protein [Streptomyces justiciae]